VAPAPPAAAALPPVLTPAPAPPDEPAAAAPDRAELLNRVSRAFLDHRQKDAFELLAVSEESTAADLEERFLRFAREFAPWRFAEPGLRLVEEYARELFLAGVRAYAELADPGRRSELALRRRLAREEGERAKRAAHHHIDTNLLDPALQFKKGMVLYEAGKLKAALQQLEFAADCDPQNGKYRAEVARCRFALSPASSGRQALEELTEAERVDPSAVEPFLYHGEIAAELARWDEAEAAYRQAAKLLGPADRRALDALRDLSAKRKKKR
jgi:tetratricopeptide (TPR) repeat protein